MIIHSTSNNLGTGCLVQVEGIDYGTTEADVRLFAQGAAGKHNAGWEIQGAELISWLDEHGRSLSAAVDTSLATGARVLCRVGQP